MIHGSYPSGKWAPDAPWGYTTEQIAAEIEWINRSWGTEAYIRWAFPSVADDERLVRWFAT